MGETMVNYIPFVGVTSPEEAQSEKEELEGAFAGRKGVTVKIDWTGDVPLGLEVWMDLPGSDDDQNE